MEKPVQFQPDVKLLSKNRAQILLLKLLVYLLNSMAHQELLFSHLKTSLECRLVLKEARAHATMKPYNLE